MNILIIFAAKYLIAIIALAAVVAIWSRPRLRVQLYAVLVVSLALGYVLARLAGVFFSHQQPFAVEGFTPLVPHEVDNSFPSDHTLLGGVFASVAWLVDWRVGVALWVLTLAVGVARIMAGLHWPVDIMASVVLAVAAVWIVHLVFRNFFHTKVLG